MDFLAEVGKRLDLVPAEKEQVMRELGSHLLEARDELVAGGMDASQAEEVAARRLGRPSEIASRLSEIHCRATWKSALLTAAPLLPAFLMATLYALQYQSASSHAAHSLSAWPQWLLGVPALLMAIAMIAFPLRELALDRRPIWFASWLAAGISYLTVLASIPGGLYLHHLRQLPVQQHSTSPLLGAQMQMQMNAIVVAIVGVTILTIGARRQPWRKAIPWVIGAFLILELAPLGLLMRETSIGALSQAASHWNVGRAFFYVLPSVILSFAIFATHRKADVTQSALFLFTSYAIGYIPLRMGYRPTIILALPQWPHFLISAAAIILFARAGSWRDKMSVLAAGVFMHGIYSVFQHPTFAMQTAFPQAVAVLLFPLAYWMLQRREIVR